MTSIQSIQSEINALDDASNIDGAAASVDASLLKHSSAYQSKSTGRRRCRVVAGQKVRQTSAICRDRAITKESPEKPEKQKKKMTKQEKNQNRGLIEREHGNNIYGSCPSRWSSFCADLIRPTFPYLFPSAASALGRPSPPFASISTDFKSMNGQQKSGFCQLH